MGRKSLSPPVESNWTGGPNMSSSNKHSQNGIAPSSFQEHEVEDYEHKRYKGIDQRIVHMRETQILRKIFRCIDREKRRHPGDIPGTGRARQPAEMVLDLPCGYGRFTGMFQDRGLKIVCSDLSFFMVKRTKEKGGPLLGRSGIVADAVQGLPFKDNIFDRIFSIRFFHHLHDAEDRHAVLKEFCRISRDWVVLSFYRRNLLHSLQRKFRKMIKGGKRQIRMISSREFRDEAEKEGLRILKMFPLIRGIHSYWMVLLMKTHE
jgi:SAM-dependent methyltransferase